MRPLKLSNAETASVCRELALMLHAGVSTVDGLYLLAEEENEKQRRELLSQLARTVEEGSPLHSALEQCGCFPPYAVGLINVGERVGRLEETLRSLADHYDEQDRIQCYIRTSLTYPAVLLLLMMVVIAVLLIKVLPVFNDVYASLGGQLSGIAGGLLSLGQLLCNALPVLWVVLAALALFALFLSLNKDFYRKVLGYWQAHWGDKGLFRKLNDLRFVQALSMGYGSGLPLENAATIAAQLLKTSPSAAERAEKCGALLSDGASISHALGETGILSPSACRLLTLGIRSGSGDSTLENIAQRMADEYRQELDRKIAVIEPTLVLICSLLVGTILLSVMLPLMNIMNALG